MKKLLALFKNRLFYIFLSCILVISAIMLPSISTAAFAIIKDPHTSIWPGGLGGDARTSIKVYIADYTNCTEEVDKFANISSADGNDAVFTFNFAKKKISAAPSSSTSYNNIDYIIYMVRELEKLAENYLLDTNANEEDYTPAQTDINNLVLGYIRGIHKNYTANGYSGYTSKWSYICGTPNRSFIKYVNNNGDTGTDITFPAFFASFLSNSSDYNSASYGTVPSKYLEKKYTLSDPLGSQQGIDFLHMIAAIDGIYSETEQNNIVLVTMLGNSTIQHDLVSWLGDLHTFTKQFYEKVPSTSSLYDYNKSFGHIDFNTFVNNQGSYSMDKFSAQDLLADIDAMNITKAFLDNSANALSDCLSAYYDTMYSDGDSNANRYSLFIYTSTIDQGAASSESALLQKFRQEVFKPMNLDYANGTCTDHEYYKPSNMVLSLLSYTETSGKDENGNPITTTLLPDISIRSYCARLFYDYIVAMSQRF